MNWFAHCLPQGFQTYVYVCGFIHSGRELIPSQSAVSARVWLARPMFTQPKLKLALLLLGCLLIRSRERYDWPLTSHSLSMNVLQEFLYWAISCQRNHSKHCVNLHDYMAIDMWSSVPLLVNHDTCKAITFGEACFIPVRPTICTSAALMGIANVLWCCWSRPGTFKGYHFMANWRQLLLLVLKD